SAETLAKWFDALAVLQRMSASSAAFQQTAAELVVSPGGLDGGAVVTRRGASWRVEASCLRRHELATVLRTDLLEQMAAMQSTMILSPSAGDRGNDVAVVCAPIVVAGETAGAMVGFRRPHGANGRRRIRPLEAQWLELVASAVGGGFCRRDAEEEAARHRILLHQAFPPAVAQLLTRNGATLEEALSPCRREVTLLFTDMRGSSVLARQCAPAEFNRLMTDVLALITDCIHREGGVVIDYAGDGVAAMWNAPANQADHAERAVRAALNIQVGLPQLSQTWRGQIHRDINLSIGIHTGKATLGNTGSADRIKYGPRGEAVSLASRVESASKAFSTPVVITEATRRRLLQNTKCRRLGKSLLPSFEQPVELYEPQPSGASDSSAQHVTDVYERALASVERGELHDALEMLLEFERTGADHALVETALQHCRELIAHGAERPATLAPDATWRESCFDVSHLLAAQHAERP
ncbi:MAG: adenylate/guanylate cyclase domain-containing protein, partial [Planctomycetales bacterium]|nr:adenylate/guanylate cyclase domain-containing protein [Planctomycetales bacterium]